MAISNITAIKKMRVVAADPANPFGLDSDGVPDPSVFDNAVFAEVSRASVSMSPAATQIENDATAGTWGNSRPIPEIGYDANGNPYKTNTGTFSCTMRTRTLGPITANSSFQTYEDLPLIIMLKSGGLAADEIADDEDWGDVLDGVATENNIATYTSGAGLVPGDLFQATVNNRAVIHNVGYIDSADDSVHFTPSWFGVAAGNAISDGSAIRTMYTMAPDITGGVPCHIELYGDTFVVRMYGCVASSIAFQTVGEFSLETAFTFEVGQFEYDYSTASVIANVALNGSVPKPCGRVPTRKGSYMTYSAPLPNECEENDLDDYMVDTAGHLCVQSFTFTITNTIEKIKCPSNVLGWQEFRINEQLAELAVTVNSANSSGNQNSNPFDNDHALERARNYALAFAPHGEGQGFGLFIGAGYQTTDVSARNVSGTYLVQDLVIHPDQWFGDNIAESGTLIAGSAAAGQRFKIGFTR